MYTNGKLFMMHTECPADVGTAVSDVNAISAASRFSGRSVDVQERGFHEGPGMTWDEYNIPCLCFIIAPPPLPPPT